jgi:hypothetical protein
MFPDTGGTSTVFSFMVYGGVAVAELTKNAEESEDPVAHEERINKDITWAVPDPFEQLKKKNTGNIGVCNPYALAPFLMKAKINWKKVDARETLMAAFVPTGLSVFSDIFNPKLSIIFSQKKISGVISGAVSTGEGAQTGAGAPAPTGKTAITYDGIIPSAGYPPPGAPPGSTPPASLPFKKIVNNNIKDVVDDSMQGPCLDCYFIAALYSRAWCNYPAFPPIPSTCPNGYNITFYKETCGSETNCATPRFPVDDHKQPVFAQMTPEWEIYPPIYEKAYAIFRDLPQSQLPGAQSGDPEISVFPPGDALLSLFHITKMKWDFTRNNTINQPSAFLTKELSQFGFPSSYYALNKNLSAAIGASRKTIYPTVAWTYDPSVESLPACSSALFGPSGPYGNDLIVANHSYSILGSITINTKNYIVLRNPWGANYIGDPSGSITQYLAVGQFTPAAGISFDLGRKPDGITTDGIFALRSDVFDCIFRGFGWVQFKCA